MHNNTTIGFEATATSTEELRVMIVTQSDDDGDPELILTMYLYVV